MNTVPEHLLACIGEEVGEVSQAVGKISRFGLKDKGPKKNYNNFQELRREVHDIVAVYGMFCEAIGEDPTFSQGLLVAKEERTRAGMELARGLGTLCPKEDPHCQLCGSVEHTADCPISVLRVSYHETKGDL